MQTIITLLCPITQHKVFLNRTRERKGPQGYKAIFLEFVPHGHVATLVARLGGQNQKEHLPILNIQQLVYVSHITSHHRGCTVKEMQNKRRCTSQFAALRSCMQSCTKPQELRYSNVKTFMARGTTHSSHSSL